MYTAVWVRSGWPGPGAVCRAVRGHRRRPRRRRRPGAGPVTSAAESRTAHAQSGPARGRCAWPMRRFVSAKRYRRASALSRRSRRARGAFKNMMVGYTTTVPCVDRGRYTYDCRVNSRHRLHSTPRQTLPRPSRGSARCTCVRAQQHGTARVHRPRCMCISRTAGWRRVHSPNGRDQGALSAPCNRSGSTSS